MLSEADNRRKNSLWHSLSECHISISHGWYRVDARGNKEGVNAHFTSPLARMGILSSIKHARDNMKNPLATNMLNFALSLVIIRPAGQKYINMNLYLE